jgi:glycosyltransferase involved in cell wall biosynthesis
VLEAFRLGLPVAASRTGGLAELLDHNQYGLLSAPEDAQSLAENLLHLLRDEDLRAHYIDAGRHRVARWPTMEGYARALDTVYGLPVDD